MTGAEFIACNLGKPWQAGADGPDAYDCWGLVRAYYRHVLGVVLPIVDVDALSPLDIRREFAAEAHRHGWHPCAPGDHAAVLMGKNARPSHVGVWWQGSVLHCVEGAGVVYQRPLALRLAGWHVLGAYRRVIR